HRPGRQAQEEPRGGRGRGRRGPAPAHGRAQGVQGRRGQGGQGGGVARVQAAPARRHYGHDPACAGA
ncbi:MAG: hypothetical protein ACJ8AG_02220, partial [Ktedonobacteraceae bacterium]